MSDQTVKDFYNKNEAQDYAGNYLREHSPRLDAFIQHFHLKDLRGQNIIDVGGGLAFLESKLDISNNFWIFDGCETSSDKYVCDVKTYKCDLDRDYFGDDFLNKTGNFKFNIGFVLETLEHLSNVYNCLAEMKKLVEQDGDIYISIPNYKMLHNYIYPALMWTPSNFVQFLEQMALPVKEYWLYDGGWPSDHYLCRNASWEESKMLFYKSEEKFRGKTPLEAVNI